VALTKAAGPFLNKYPLRGEEQLVWPHIVVTSLAVFMTALFLVGVLSIIFDTLP
jgi:hypothetical protein